MPHESATRSEIEYGSSWAAENPDLFTERMFAFQIDYPVAVWQHRVDFSRPGYITLIGIRRKQPYDREKDWLKEIGVTGEQP